MSYIRCCGLSRLGRRNSSSSFRGSSSSFLLSLSICIFLLLLPPSSIGFGRTPLFRKTCFFFLYLPLLGCASLLLLFQALKLFLPLTPLCGFSLSLCRPFGLKSPALFFFLLLALAFLLQGFCLIGLDCAAKNALVFGGCLCKGLLMESFLFSIPLVL